MTQITVETLWQAAVRVRNHAYAPYSGYAVGAALTLQGHDRIFTGCNVENASYGATICAERNAIFQAIAAVGGTPRLERLVLVTEQPAPPCGMCLQVLSEFSTETTLLVLATPEHPGEEVHFSSFLPQPFSPNSLPDHA